MTTGPHDLSGLSALVQTGRHYSRAPIVEAILQLTVALPEDVTLDTLTHVVERDDQYPDMKPQAVFQGQFEVAEDDIKASGSAAQVGWVWPRRDGGRVVQALRDRFVFSWTSPYDKWESFLAEAEQLWLRYRNTARPLSVNNVGVRFINKIVVPAEAVEIKDYLRTSVDVSPYLPQMISRLFLQVDVPLPTYDVLATVTSLLSPPPGLGQTALVLDIDAKRQVAMEVKSPLFDRELRACLDTLREAKNYVFEACITDATRGLIS